MNKKNIVVIGGGNGSAITLRALKGLELPLNIQAVVSVADSGGSSGRLRKDLDVIPPGDILRAILALSKYEYDVLRDIFYTRRFEDLDPISGHNIGNLFLALVSKKTNNIIFSIRAFEQAICSVGKVHPVSLDSVHLLAKLQDGVILQRESDIDRPSKNNKSKIQKVWLSPEGSLYEGAHDAIKSADYIFFGPGSLYTSIIPPLLIKGAKEAVRSSQAKKVFILANAYAKNGEQGPDRASECIKEFEAYLGGKSDKIIFNHCPRLSARQKQAYEINQWQKISNDIEKIQDDKYLIEDMESRDGGTDIDRLKSVLRAIIR